MVTRLYLDAEAGTCDHVRLIAYSDAARTHKVGERIKTISELKQEATEEEIDAEIEAHMRIAAKRALGNNPLATKADLRTAIRAWECWV